MLKIVPISFADANAFVKALHRHHKPVPGCKFCVAVAIADKIVGVAIVGHPISRMLDDGWTLEVNRTCTDGSRNANSMLYGVARRIGREFGYKKAVTYTLPSESGASLRAAGWICMGEAGGGKWSRQGRSRLDLHPIETKLRWEVDLNP